MRCDTHTTKRASPNGRASLPIIPYPPPSPLGSASATLTCTYILCQEARLPPHLSGKLNRREQIGNRQSKNVMIPGPHNMAPWGISILLRLRVRLREKAFFCCSEGRVFES